MNEQDILNFWFSPEHRSLWFAKSDDFDKKIRDQFADIHRQATQAGSSIDLRHSKIRGAFYVDKSMSALLHNKTVIMVDDVMTSGATLNEIARILKDNGVLHITNWVLLRTCKSP